MVSPEWVKGRQNLRSNIPQKVKEEVEVSDPEDEDIFEDIAKFVAEPEFVEGSSSLVLRSQTRAEKSITTHDSESFEILGA
jgi:hypothetical protein